MENSSPSASKDQPFIFGSPHSATGASNDQPFIFGSPNTTRPSPQQGFSFSGAPLSSSPYSSTSPFSTSLALPPSLLVRHDASEDPLGRRSVGSPSDIPTLQSFPAPLSLKPAVERQRTPVDSLSSSKIVGDAHQRKRPFEPAVSAKIDKSFDDDSSDDASCAKITHVPSYVPASRSSEVGGSEIIPVAASIPLPQLEAYESTPTLVTLGAEGASESIPKQSNSSHNLEECMKTVLGRLPTDVAIRVATYLSEPTARALRLSCKAGLALFDSQENRTKWRSELERAGLEIGSRSFSRGEGCLLFANSWGLSYVMLQRHKQQTRDELSSMDSRDELTTVRSRDCIECGKRTSKTSVPSVFYGCSLCKNCFTPKNYLDRPSVFSTYFFEQDLIVRFESHFNSILRSDVEVLLQGLYGWMPKPGNTQLSDYIGHLPEMEPENFLNHKALWAIKTHLWFMRGRAEEQMLKYLIQLGHDTKLVEELLEKVTAADGVHMLSNYLLNNVFEGLERFHRYLVLQETLKCFKLDIQLIQSSGECRRYVMHPLPHVTLFHVIDVCFSQINNVKGGKLRLVTDPYDWPWMGKGDTETVKKILAIEKQITKAPASGFPVFPWTTWGEIEQYCDFWFVKEHDVNSLGVVASSVKAIYQGLKEGASLGQWESNADYLLEQESDIDDFDEEEELEENEYLANEQEVVDEEEDYGGNTQLHHIFNVDGQVMTFEELFGVPDPLRMGPNDEYGDEDDTDFDIFREQFMHIHLSHDG